MDHIATERASASRSQDAAGNVAPPKAKPKIPVVDVNAVLFRAASEFCSDEETRYYLQGVYIQPHPENGVLLVATDGHRLLVVHDETGSCSEATIIKVEARGLAGIKFDPKKPNDPPRLKLDAEGSVIVGTYRSISSAIIDATYPDYARILMPMVEALKKGVFSPASFNHEYLAGFSKIAALICNGKRPIRLISTAEGDPALILFEGAPHAFGVLVPMRTICQNGMPAFMRHILEPPQAKAPDIGTSIAKPKRTVTKKKPARPVAKKAKRAKTRR